MILTVIAIVAASVAFGLGVKRWITSTAKTATAISVSGTGKTDTEFSAEVVRITQVLPHPNADRLEILRFEMAGTGETSYEVVSQKGTFQAGDLAAYFSVDCILPLSHPDFAFLGERLDGKGKTHYRLRAARLRGVFSQGLLVPVSAPGTLGSSVATEYGVTYHVAPSDEPKGMTLPGVKRVKVQPMPVYSVDSLKKNPRLFAEGDLVVVTEKIHGTNFRFGWLRRKVLGIPFGWKFVVGSHRTIRGDGKSGYYEGDLYLEAAEKMGLADLVKKYRGYVFYGELFGHTYSGQKIQDMTYDKGGLIPTHRPQLRIFDVKGPSGWLQPAEREEVVTSVDLMTPPLIYTGSFESDFIKSLAEGKSLLASGQVREGVVVETVSGPRKKAKYVGEGYLTRKEAA